MRRRMPVGGDILCLRTLNVGEEEELVLNNGTTEGETPGLALVGIGL